MEERNVEKEIRSLSYPIRGTIPPGATCSSWIAGGSRAETVISIALLPLSCSQRARFFFFSFPFTPDESRFNEPRQPFLYEKRGIIIILFGTKIGADRFNKRIKIYSIFPLVYVDSTLFLVLAIFSSISSVIDLDLLRSRIGKITWLQYLLIN